MYYFFNHLCSFILFTVGVVNSQTADPDEAFCTTVPDNVPGVCISLKSQLLHCPKWGEIVRSKNEAEWQTMRQNFCSTTIQNGRVCCPLEGDGSYEEDLVRDPVPATPDYRNHKNWDMFSIKNTRCGLVVSANRVLGGKDAALGQFPWMARIGFKKENGQNLFSCSGSIINKKYILTASHCLLGYKLGYKLAPVRLAENDDSKNPEYSPESGLVHYRDFEIEDVHFHPNYTMNKTSPHDIALIRLKEEIANLTTDYYARAICLPFVNEYNIGTQLDEAEMVRRKNDKSKKFRPQVAGWGKTDNKTDNTAGSSILQHLDVPIQPSIMCRILYGDKYLTKHICSGGEANKNSCWGDSGSPLMFDASQSVTARSNKTLNIIRKFQIGIVSFGRTNCGLEGIPVVYTRVQDYLSWILDTVKP